MYSALWYKQHTTDPFVVKSKTDGYRARSAFKLLQIHEKYNLFKPGDFILDCGASPGSWSQVATKFVSTTERNVTLSYVGSMLIDIDA